MMKIEIVRSSVVGRSPTCIRLSDNDNVMPRVYSQLLFLYQNYGNTANFMPSEDLKTTLADTLVDFNELTGRLKTLKNGGLEVECDNQGASWVEQDIDLGIQDFDPNNGFPQQKLPDGLLSVPTTEEGFLLKVQLTRLLKDGSVVLGVAVHHSLTDGHGLFWFLRCWTLRCSGNPVKQPKTDRSLLFGQPLTADFDLPEYTTKQRSPEERVQFAERVKNAKLTARVFLLTTDGLNRLKEIVKVGSQ